MIKKIASVGISGLLLVAPLLVSADTLTRQLQLGMTGSDVGTLQTFLAKDITLYPQGLITNYFGFLTKSAVSNFQSRNGIAAVGRVGPVTLTAINAQMLNGGVTGTASYSPIISGVLVNAYSTNASIIWNTNISAKGMVYYSTSPLSTYENETSVTVSGNTAMTDGNFHLAQNLSLTGLQANTTYYYLIYTTDQMGNVSVTWPSSFHTAN